MARKSIKPEPAATSAPTTGAPTPVAKEAIEPSPMHSVLTSDPSGRAMVELLACNGERLGLVSGESQTFQNIEEMQKNRGAQLLLDAWSGAPHHYSRHGFDVNLTAPEVTCCLLAQPGPVAKVLQSETLTAVGFMQRFNFAIVPQTKPGAYEDAPNMDPELIARWTAWISFFNNKENSNGR